MPEVVGEINGYLERMAPWREAKAGHVERVATILDAAPEALRLGKGLGWGGLQPGTGVVLGPPLFPRDVS